jgi:hypothetical protein
MAMIKTTLLCATAIAASSVLLSSAVAQANPETPTPVLESSAAQPCGAVTSNPTEIGAMEGLTRSPNRGLDQADRAMVLIALMMSVMAPMAAEEVVCTKPT